MKKKLFAIVTLSFALALSGCGGTDQQETVESTVGESSDSTSAAAPTPELIENEKEDRNGYDEANNTKVQFWGHDLSIPSYWINSGDDSFDNYTYYANENGTIAAMMQFQCHSTGSMNRDNIESDFEDVLGSLADSLSDFNVSDSGTSIFCDEDAYTADFTCTMNDNTPMKCKVVTTKHSGSSNMYGFFLLQSEDSKYDYFGDFEKMLSSAVYGNSSNTVTTESSEKANIPAEYQSALNKAQTYSDMMHMSKQGLYDQLTSEYGEKFSAEAAQYAIDNVNADWNANALAKAQDYSDTLHMSKQGVYDQLISEYGEKFLPEEAQYAVDNVQADWNQNALEKAKSYQEMMDMSPEAIREQLVSEYGEKFTQEEADYAIANLPQ